MPKGRRPGGFAPRAEPLRRDGVRVNHKRVYRLRVSVAVGSPPGSLTNWPPRRNQVPLDARPQGG